MSYWKASGSISPASHPEPSRRTSPGCARSWKTTRRRRGTSIRSAEWAAGSRRECQKKTPGWTRYPGAERNVCVRFRWPLAVSSMVPPFTAEIQFYTYLYGTGTRDPNGPHKKVAPRPDRMVVESTKSRAGSLREGGFRGRRKLAQDDFSSRDPGVCTAPASRRHEAEVGGSFPGAGG